MRQTPHDLRMYEILIEDGKGLFVKGPVLERAEDLALPLSVRERILKAKKKKEESP